MKLLRAEFENFRLLRGLELRFSTDAEHNLTVIRAANETGKTTILTALQWALYGDIALPGKGRRYRLHPIDWNAEKGQRVPVTVAVDFEVTNWRKSSRGIIETRQQYRIVRSALEEVRGTKWSRQPSTVRLYALTDRGAESIETPEALVNEELPPELREVFFTDGDRALSFIEADVAVSTKRQRVQNAIRSLLGLSIIEDAIRHVTKSTAEANKKAKKLETTGDLNTIASHLQAIDEDIERLQAEYQDAMEQFAAFDEKFNSIDRKIAEALQKGDKEKLKKSLENIDREIKQMDSRIESAEKDHLALFRSEALSIDLLSPVLGDAFQKLTDLRDQGKIPNTTIPVLEERLNQAKCICGETLDENNPDGNRRRLHIQKLIDDSKDADEIQIIITDLYYGSKALQKSPEQRESEWLQQYKRVVENRDGLAILREQAGKKKRAIELEIDRLPDRDIQGLRETKKKYKDQRDRYLQKKSSLETKLDNLNRDRAFLIVERDRLLRIQDKGTRVLSELIVTQDIVNVLKSSYDKITNEELARVSEQMNEIFLVMIGADPEQFAIIKRAEISKEFDIIVYGPQGRTLDPDRDLNGASRRALTLAFILSLTIVSEVEAPNVIDTPLGMMSGYVKRSVLRTAIQKSSQLILFLTHDEISGCEEILDEAAGVVVTLTNPAHYPKMLVNDPHFTEQTILSCDCTHRDECQLCQRAVDAEDEFEESI
ncbi:MAG: AAA family ATPase [Deltaproteobacteria bacterium]|nr:AAA family ATPase [Deltaproteobacteria bacterium]